MSGHTVQILQGHSDMLDRI